MESFSIDGANLLDGRCTFIEPPLQMLEKIRRTRDGEGFQGTLPFPQHRHVYSLIPDNVKSHFDLANERAWLDSLPAGGKFTRLPVGSKPDCVPGSLQRALAAAGDAAAAAVVAEREDEIIAARGKNAKGETIDRKGDRIKYAAIDVVKPLCHYDARSITVDCALGVDPASVSLLKLKSKDGTIRTHALTIYDGCIFDSAEAEPLPLTVENLSRCLGAPYGGIIKKASYYFVKQVAKGARKRAAVESASSTPPAAKRPCQA